MEERQAEAGGTETGLGSAHGDEAAEGQQTERRPGGRRYRAGRPSPGRREAQQWSRPAGGRPGAEATPFPDRTATVGTLAGVLAVCLACCLLAAWLHVDAVAGLGFCAGTWAAAGYARQAALLTVVVSMPAVFLAAEIIAQLATMPAGTHRGTLTLVLAGTLLTLASVAPWLFAGTAGTFVIAMCRGLPRCVQALRDNLTGRARTARPRARRRPGELARPPDR